MNCINSGKSDSSLQHYLKSFSRNSLSAPQELDQGGRGGQLGFTVSTIVTATPKSQGDHFWLWQIYAVLDVPRHVAVTVCSSGAKAICTFLEWRELGFTEGKGLALGQRANVTIVCAASVPICPFSLSKSMPVRCCRIQSVPRLEFGQETVANTPTLFFMQTWFMTLILF